MTRHLHRLAGCTPTPLAHYLKALGVLRLVAEQKDPDARGFFRDDVFHLVTSLDPAALAAFFLDEYSPTPFIAPWNGGSGFYPKDAQDGIGAIERSTLTRFEAYRKAITVARGLVGLMTERPTESAKAAFQARCRADLGEDALGWMNAAVVVASSLETGKPYYPALLGSGGNDGRLDFTNNAMQRLVELLDVEQGGARPGTAALLDLALFGATASGLVSKAIGQFMPGAAGGANASSGFGGESLMNPWDFVLMLEGAVVLAVSSSRVMTAGDIVQAAAPFAVHSTAAGHGTASLQDVNARGEQWMPLWDRPAGLGEVRRLFAEGRLRSGGGDARRGLDVARAIAQLGVSRGIVAFERYGYVERNGQANLAVPFGRWNVTPRPEARLLDEVDPWVERLRRQSDEPGAPASLGRALRSLHAAMFDVLREGGSARWRQLLLLLGAAERLVISRPRGAADVGPLPQLHESWITQAGEGTEVRLAAAIASQRASGKASELGGIRAHLMPLEAGSRFPRLATGANGLLRDPRVVWTDRGLVADLIAIVERRLMEAARSATSQLPLSGLLSASVSDVEDFVFGRVDDALIAGLARPFMAVSWTGEGTERLARSWRPRQVGRFTPAVALFRVLYAADSLDGASPSLDAAPLRLLAAGRLPQAAGRALARLRARDARPRVRHLAGSADFARRIAASLAIPISRFDLERALVSITKPSRDSSPDSSPNGESRDITGGSSS